MSIQRADVVDFLVVDDECLVLTHEGQAVRLSALPTAIFEFLDSPTSKDEIQRHLEERFGPPPEGDASDVLADIISTLVARGVLIQERDG